MKTRFLQQTAAALACAGMLLPQSVLAAPASLGPAPRDIALRTGGVMVGQVVDVQGKALADSEVAMYFGQAEVVRTKTDANGVFAAKGLRGGEYTVVAGGGQVAYRLWAPGTAPPAASNGALVITGDEVINGQCNSCGPAGCPPAGLPPAGGGGGLVGWVKSHPLLVAGGVAAAIAIPLAVADDDDGS